MAKTKAEKSVKIPLEVWRQVAQQSLNCGTPIKDLVAHAVREYLHERELVAKGR